MFLLGALFIAIVVFHLAVYAHDGTSLSDVRWQIHAGMTVIGIGFTALGSSPILKGFMK